MNITHNCTVEGGIKVTTKKEEQVRVLDLFMITIGCATYAFALVMFNIANQLADGGISGVTLILRALFHIDPAYSTIIINIPLIWIGYRFLGRRAIIYTLYGTVMLSAFLWIWQRVPMAIDLHHDLFLSAMAAGITGGAGSGYSIVLVAPLVEQILSPASLNVSVAFRWDRRYFG